MLVADASHAAVAIETGSEWITTDRAFRPLHRPPVADHGIHCLRKRSGMRPAGRIIPPSDALVGEVIIALIMSTIVPATAVSRAALPALPPRGGVTLAMYDRMISAGVFEPRQEHPLELIEGALQMMSPIGDRHADAVDWLVRWSMMQVDLSRILVRVKNPIAIPTSESAPQPDLAWVTLRRYIDRRPLPEEVMLVVEIADTSLDHDTTTKAALYAAAGIADYWVVDLVARAVIVFRDPVAGRYDTRTTHRAGRPLFPLACPEATLEPAELFVD